MILRYLMGWKTSRKIIVFESDDWGSFRFKDKNIRDKYIKTYDPRGWMHYNDCFESREDLNHLQEALNSVKDKNNNFSCFTFLMNPANPNFDKIKQSNFETFYNETFLETLAKRNDGKQIFDWYKNALSENLIEVGFHGREHLNVKSWMEDLKQGDKITRLGFEDNIWGHNVIFGAEHKKRHRSTYNIKNHNELKALKINIKEGIQILNDTFNQKTAYFLPPDGPYHLSLNSELKKNSIQYIGLPKGHNNPLEAKWHQKKMFWLGKQTKEGLVIITRNVTFEPSSPKSKDWVNKALKDIDKAFKYKTPAVISTHRANYTGSLNQTNRFNSQKQLKDLLSQITKRWPDVEFMTSSQLGREISLNMNHFQFSLFLGA